MGETTYATGGSATSQAEDAVWHARPVIAWVLRVIMFLAPVAASLSMSRIYGMLVPIDVIGTAAYWGGLLVVAVATAIVVEQRAQSMMSLVTLFNMSLVFPDRAPSRFGVALRAGHVKRLKERADELGDSEPAADLLVLVKELSRHDPRTRGHSERVRAYTDLIAEEIGLPQEDRDRLAWASLAHDVGKLAVRPSTLNKDGRPNDEEWAEIRGHPGAAVPHLAPLEAWLGEWALAASQHHERWDGKGYPLGLKGEEISRAGRIVAVADAYDVMTSARSYKKPLSAEAARSELVNNAGTQFDPLVVRAFLNIGIRKLHVAGPLAWLSEFAWFVRIPQAVSTVSSTAAAAAISVAAVVAGPVVATEGPPPVDELGAERAVTEEAAAPEPGEPIEVVTPVETTTSVGPTTTTTTVVVTTTAPAAAPTTTAPPTTTTAPSPVVTTTTTAPPTTTTAPPTTTTTAPPTTTTTTTTTTTAPAAGTGFVTPVFMDGKEGPAETFSKLDGVLDAVALANYDTDRNDDPGLTLKRGDGMTETDPSRRHRFRTQSPDQLLLQGTPRLEIWASVRNHEAGRNGAVIVSLEDCTSNKTDCTVIATGLAAFAQDDFGADFGRVVVDLTAVDRELAPNRSLIVNLFVHDASDDDLWFAWGTTTYPASFQIN